MMFELENMVQRGHVFAIVDEVDSILIDEARTPLIISGPSEENTDIYYKCNRVIPHLVKGAEDKDKHGNKTTTGDYLVDEKSRTAVLTRRASPRRRRSSASTTCTTSRTSTRSMGSSRRCAPTPCTSATSTT